MPTRGSMAFLRTPPPCSHHHRKVTQWELWTETKLKLWLFQSLSVLSKTRSNSVSADPSHFNSANQVPLALLTSEMALTNSAPIPHSPSHTSSDSFGFRCGPPPAPSPPNPASPTAGDVWTKPITRYSTKPPHRHHQMMDEARTPTPDGV